MIMSGYDVNEPLDDHGTTILMFAIHTRNDQLLDKLLDLIARPNLNAQDSNGRTALHFACRSGFLKGV